ncbi:leucyl aminopeptidase [Nakamurella sp. YIM 132087]|uniref:Probable cytosol aminopeptidase n=1 Tax=Nakamurella alba TaxID=2665158 RepID=A0A7K1FHD0_9ACTN|nr:leucyl aminopeptidase [Nakamurella alba]MTD13508.1 leucyl aminopeptidase [Nakamurella alba]
MTELTLSSADPTAARADALVVGLYKGEDGPVATDERFAAAAAALAVVGATGKAGEVTVTGGAGVVGAGRLVGIGLGDADAAGTPAGAETVRKSAGIVTRSLAGLKRAVSTLGSVDLAAAAQGHLLGGYVFDRYKEPAKAPVGTVVLAVPRNDKAAKAELRTALITAEAVLLARDLVNTAPNDLPPEVFAARASTAAGEAGLEVTIWDEKQLADEGFGGILAVGSGSSRPPRLVRIAYTPADAVTSVALVGKGICFDSGGLSIKPAQGMENMTSDMSGAAAVVATVIGAAALELPVAVTAWAALAENLVSGTSYRPGDVLRHYGGKTVHVLNTDAEGRLVLADAIVRASEEEPDYLIETSTLTGAQVVALGNRTMGIMGEEGLRDRVAQIAREVGEGGWAMPLPPELREGLDSPIADLQNVNWNRVGGMLTAGHYLAAFVPDGLPWAHLDVAGPAYNTGSTYGYQPQGATGVPVRTLLAVLEDLSS